MPDRETKPDKNASGDAKNRGTDRNQPQDPDLGERTDPDSEQSTNSRPRGHTEEPDRTL